MITACSFPWNQLDLCQRLENAPWESWFPNERKKVVQSLVVGSLAAIATFFTLLSFKYVLQACCENFKLSYDVIEKSNSFLNVAWGAIWRLFVVVVGPICEEILLRGVLNEAFKKEEESLCDKVCRIATVALIFGISHLSLFQTSISNFYNVVSATFIGCVLGVLKEKREDLIAPIVTHILFNLCAVR